MARFNLIRLVSWVLLAGVAILLGSDGEAQVHPIRWTGSVTCTITLTGMGTLNEKYSDSKTHTWTILPFFESRVPPPRISYSYIWTVTGMGAKAPESWVTNGHDGGPPNFEARISFDQNSSGDLFIHTITGQRVDQRGITVSDGSGHQSFATAFEEGLPNITAAWGSTDVNGHINEPMLSPGNYVGGYQQPGDVLQNGVRVGWIDANRDCNWQFHFGAVLMPTPPKLSLPDKPHPYKPAPAEAGHDRPSPSLAPLALATVSVFFGGPGNGTVTASPGYPCTSDCTIGYRYPSQGSTITLTATPDATSVFAGWGGPSCTGTSPTCTVMLGASNRVIAYFRSKFKMVAAGAYHTCALRPAGHVVCWGYNAEGEIGTGILNTAPLAPSSVTGITTAVAIAAGGYHTCALLVGGTVTCWGKNNDGQLGDAMSFPTSNATPMTVPGITQALAVTAGGAHTCVVLAGGSASCWGLNGDGQLGASSTPSYHTPTPVTVGTVGPLTKQIAAGAYHTCAIVAADSSVACWGLNRDGQAGQATSGTPGRVLEPGPGCTGDGCIIPPGGGPCDPSAGGCGDIIPFLNKVTTIAASIGAGQLLGGPPLGGYHTVALDSSGMDWGWGNNNDGQVPFPGGDVAAKDPSPPGPTPMKISAGAYHTCILDSTLGVFCRGNNSNSQSGPSPPGFVPMTTSAVDVAAGGYHTCAVIVSPPSTPTAGSVACWGLNWNGEVDGTFHGSDVTTPLVLSVP